MEGVLSNKIRLRLKYQLYEKTVLANTVKPYVWIKEVSAIGVREISTLGTSLYTRLNGEVLAGTSGGVNSDTVFKAFKMMLHNYDGFTIGEWSSSCDVDLTNLNGERDDDTGKKWYVGRQLLEKVKGFDIFSELCRESFCAMFQSRTGRKIVTAFLDRTDHRHPKHDSSYILRDSIDTFEKTKVSDLYNEFTVNYSIDPETGKGMRSFTVAHVDESAFPLETDVDSSGNVIWPKYCSGFKNFSDAKSVWDLCHASYLQVKVLNEYNIDLKWFPDLRIYEGDETETDGVDVDSAAYNHLENAVGWLTKKKTKTRYAIALNRVNILAELCDPVVFKDDIFTYGEEREGLINGVEIDVKNDRLLIRTTLRPED
jgi:hypothetical protein